MERIHYRADWIWRRRGLSKLPFTGGMPPFSAEMNRYVLFRKVAVLQAEILRVSGRNFAGDMTRCPALAHYLCRTLPIPQSGEIMDWGDPAQPLQRQA